MKIEIQFSIFNFWKRKYFSSNSEFEIQFEKKFTLNSVYFKFEK